MKNVLVLLTCLVSLTAVRADETRSATSLDLAVGYVRGGALQGVAGSTVIEAPNGAMVSIHGQLKRQGENVGPEGREIRIRRDGALHASVVTDGSGSFDYREVLPGGAASPVFTYEAVFEGDLHYLRSTSNAGTIRQKPRAVGSAYSEPKRVSPPAGTTIHAGDPVMLSAKITSMFTGAAGATGPPIPNVGVRFVLTNLGRGNPQPFGPVLVSDAEGLVTLPWVPEHGGSFFLITQITDPLWVDGNAAEHLWGYAALEMQIGGRATVLRCAGSPTAVSGHVLSLKAHLSTKNDGKPLANRRIQAGNFSGMTNALGDADIQIKADATLGVGHRTIPVLFPGEPDYETSSASLEIDLAPNDS